MIPCPSPPVEHRPTSSARPARGRRRPSRAPEQHLPVQIDQPGRQLGPSDVHREVAGHVPTLGGRPSRTTRSESRPRESLDASTLHVRDGRRARRAHLPDLFDVIAGNISRAVQGKRESIELALTGLLAEGHLLIEDVPGVGKTSLAKAIAASIDCTWRRVQCTPDLLPSDVTGVTVWHRGRDSFEFQPVRCSATSSSPTRSTVPRLARSPRCSKRWRSGRSRRTASPTHSNVPSS